MTEPAERDPSVDVAIVPAAGRGTRMRPATRVLPKALLPVVDRPALQWVAEEAVRAGVTEIVVIVDPGVEELVERHFAEEGPLPGLEDLQVTTVVQEVPAGLGDAVRLAREAVADRPFFCMLADNLAAPHGGGFADVLADMAKLAAGVDDAMVLCVREVSDELLSAYGVVAVEAGGDVLRVRGAVEKPGPAAAPSRLGLVGRYLFPPAIFDALAEARPGVGGEIQLTDAIDALARSMPAFAHVTDVDLLDVGTPFGLVQATTALGLADPRFGPAYRRWLRTTLGDEG